MSGSIVRTIEKGEKMKKVKTKSAKLKKVFNFKLWFLAFSFAFLASACGATSVNSNLDKARFALDQCKATNTAACTTALNDANNVLASEPNNTDAALIKSAALATSGGLDMLSLISSLAETGATNESQKFKLVYDAVIANVQDVDDLRTAITALTGITAPVATDTIYKDYYFQLGILRAIEAFSLPTVKAQASGTSAVTVANITQTHKDSVQDDFLNADKDLIKGGIADATVSGWDLVKAVRQNYCTLKNLMLPGTQGFNLALLQDLISCQLCIDVTDVSICAKPAANMVAADFLSGLVATCASFDFAACENAGETAL